MHNYYKSFTINRIITFMSTSFQHISNYDPPSESLQLKVAFSERMSGRLKEENAKQVQKISKLSEDVALLQRERTDLQSQIASLQKQLEYSKFQNQGLVKQLEVRQLRHDCQKTHFLPRQEQEILLKLVQQRQGELSQAKVQMGDLMKRCHEFLLQIEQAKIQKAVLGNQLEVISLSLKDNAEKTRELQKLYGQKIQVLETQNYDLKRQSQSLILELELVERHKQIEGLLIYEKKIGVTPKSTTARYDNKNSTMRTAISNSQVQLLKTGPYNVGERKCCCLELQEELIERDELIDLLKQKNRNLLSEVQSCKRRCANLQGIICSKMGAKV